MLSVFIDQFSSLFSQISINFLMLKFCCAYEALLHFANKMDFFIHVYALL